MTNAVDKLLRDHLQKLGFKNTEANGITLFGLPVGKKDFIGDFAKAHRTTVEEKCVELRNISAIGQMDPTSYFRGALQRD